MKVLHCFYWRPKHQAVKTPLPNWEIFANSLGIFKILDHAFGWSGHFRSLEARFLWKSYQDFFIIFFGVIWILILLQKRSNFSLFSIFYLFLSIFLQSWSIFALSFSYFFSSSIWYLLHSFKMAMSYFFLGQEPEFFGNYPSRKRGIFESSLKKCVKQWDKLMAILLVKKSDGFEIWQG